MDENIEYKIPEAEELSTEQQSEDITDSERPPEAKKRLEFLKNIDKRKIILPLGLLFVILIAYKALEFYGLRKAKMVEQQKAQMQNIAAKPVERSVATIPQKVIYSTEPSMHEVSSNNQDYEALRQRTAKIEADTYQNNVKLNNLGNAVNVVQDNIAIIDKNVRQVSDVLQQELAQVEQLKKSLNKPAKHRKIKKPNVIKYHIRALVPGRAWIESENGRYSKTLKVGDELAGYGTVDYILYKDGMILMSNGSYIEYGQNDS